MGSPSVNPFDKPLASEVQEHQQAQAATQQTTGNPFDEPLASEKAEVSHKEAMAASPANNFVSGSKVPNAILNGSDTTGDIIGGATIAGAGAMAAAPVIDMASPVIKHIATEYGEPAVKAIKDAAESHPIVAKLLGHALETAALLKMAQYMNVFSKMSSGK